MNALKTNAEIWDRLYDQGNYLAYPGGVFVRLTKRVEQSVGLAGVVLDHGCGSGVNAEHLVRAGHRVHCSDVSAGALRTTTERFRYRLLPAPAATLIDPTKPLGPQLPAYDHVVAWLSMVYGTKERFRADVADLIAGLPTGGVFMIAMSTGDDVLAVRSSPLPDGSRRVDRELGGQEGVTVVIPRSLEELIGWCPGVTVRDVAAFGETINDLRSDFMAFWGIKT